jgi:hypothetical protein
MQSDTCLVTGRAGSPGATHVLHARYDAASGIGIEV